MISRILNRSELAALGRLDAWYYLAPGAGAARRLDKAKAAGLKTVPLGGDAGLGKAWMPGRLKQALAAPGERAKPYIKPHDLFQYLPEAHALLSANKTRSCIGSRRLDLGGMIGRMPRISRLERTVSPS